MKVDNDGGQESWDHLIESYRNRKKYPVLTLEILQSIPDDLLEQAIVDYIDAKITTYQEELRIVSQMSDGLQMVYSTWILEGEVSNGGFNQFFFNSSGQYTEMALRSFQLLGAEDYYHILQKAKAIHEQDLKNSTFRKLFMKRTIEAFFKTYELTTLDKCDNAFYELKNKLNSLRIKYIREHPEDFISG